MDEKKSEEYCKLLKHLCAMPMGAYTMDKYIVDNMGVYFEEDKLDKNGNKKMFLVTRTPLLPVGISENATTGEVQITIAFLYTNNEVKTFTCEYDTISNRGKIIYLARQGVDVTSDNAVLLMRCLCDLIILNIKSGALIPQKAVNQLGWKKIDDEMHFLPYTDEARCDVTGADSQIVSALIEHEGAVNEWTDHVGKICENNAMRICVAASFASVLIPIIGQLPFIVHIWGMTGTGKTVALKVIASVWGNPKAGGLIRSMNSTKSALLATAAFLCHLPLICDELQTLKQKVPNFDDLVMDITEGIDRSRLNKNAEKKETLGWELAAVFSGEEPITHQNSGGGVKNRVIEIAVPPEKKLIEDGRKTAMFVSEHFGTAGPEFIKRIQKMSREEIRAIFEACFTEIMEKCDTSEKQAGAMATIMTADKIIHELFWPKLPDLKVEDVAPFLCSAKTVDISERAFEFLCDLIAQNPNRFLISGYGTSYNEIWGEKCADAYYIIKSVATKELAKEGYNFDAVKRDWAEKGYIVKQGASFAYRKRFGDSSVYCLRIPISALERN